MDTGNFTRVPLGAVLPRGWLKDFLNTQAEGLTGHLNEIGYPYSIAFWKGEIREGETPPWEVFEQTAYWLDGMYSCGVLTGREDLCARADESFGYALSHVAEDGFIGSDVLRQKSGWHRWPHVVFFRGLMAKYEHTGDRRIPEAVRDFYLKGQYDYSEKREFLHIEPMLWAYGVTGDARLLSLAESTYKNYNARCLDDNCEEVMLSEKKPYAHGVTYDETGKIGALLYLYTKNRRYLAASVHAFEKLDTMFMLADGGHCSNEFLIGNDSLQSHELCTVTDYTWALSYLFMATGDPLYADKIEKCIFNAGIGAVREDFSAIQYFSCPNQVIAAENSNHNEFFRGTGWMRYNARHHTACCSGNCNRFMPNFCRHMWFLRGGEPYAVLYAPGTFTFTRGKHTVTVEQTEAYPFTDELSFTVHTADPARFALHLRVPSWSRGASLTLNGQAVEAAFAGGFCRIERVFCEGDVLRLQLYPQVRVQDSADGGLYIERGALVYSLGVKIREHVTQAAESALPDYEYFPDSQWNFALRKSELTDGNVRFSRRELCGDPWDAAHVPVSLEVPAHTIEGWDLERKKEVVQCYDLYAKKRRTLQGDFVFTPCLPDRNILSAAGGAEYIKLIPQGAAKLRVTVFPQIGV